MRLRLEPFAHIDQPFFIARLDAHVNVRQPARDQPLDYVFVNLVRTTTNLERHLAGQTLGGD